jgi:hypothetical protein
VIIIDLNSTTMNPNRTGCDRRGLFWQAVATYAGRRFVVTSHQPVRVALRAVIEASPGFTDCAWEMRRDGRVDLSGPSARRMAGLAVEEGGRDAPVEARRGRV